VDASGSRCYPSSQNRSVPDVVRLIEIRPSWSTPEATYAMSSSSSASAKVHIISSPYRFARQTNTGATRVIPDPRNELRIVRVTRKRSAVVCRDDNSVRSKETTCNIVGSP